MDDRQIITVITDVDSNVKVKEGNGMDDGQILAVITDVENNVKVKEIITDVDSNVKVKEDNDMDDGQILAALAVITDVESNVKVKEIITDAESNVKVKEDHNMDDDLILAVATDVENDAKVKEIYEYPSHENPTDRDPINFQLMALDNKGIISSIPIKTKKYIIFGIVFWTIIVSIILMVVMRALETRDDTKSPLGMARNEPAVWGAPPIAASSSGPAVSSTTFPSISLTTFETIPLTAYPTISPTVSLTISPTTHLAAFPPTTSTQSAAPIFYEVQSGTCKTNGYQNIYEHFKCVEAMISLGHNQEWKPYEGPIMTIVVDGCSLMEEQYLFLESSGSCQVKPLVKTKHWWTSMIDLLVAPVDDYYAGDVISKESASCKCSDFHPCLCQ